MSVRLIYLIRHGEPEIPSRDLFYGITDLSLSQKGREEASKIAAVLANLKIDITLCSPLLRCTQTASLAGKKPVIVENLREIDLGKWEMRSRHEIQRETPEAYRKRGENLASYRIPGGETFEEVSQRAVSTLRNLSENDKNVAIFGHAGVFRTILWKILGIDLSSTFKIVHDYCGIHVLRQTEKGFYLLHSNWKPAIA